MFDELTVICGRDKSGSDEKVREFSIKKSEIYSIVGFTGSGKSQLIQDIELLSQGDGLSCRSVLVDGKIPDAAMRYDPRKKIIAHLSQNMNFMVDMKVFDFLEIHSKCRMKSGHVQNDIRDHINRIVYTANQLTGESIKPDDKLTRLSGGQSRALMIADVAINGNAPIVLIDEIENAGINRLKAMEILASEGKIVLIVTHDPVLALIAKKRVVMKNGGIEAVITTSEKEKKILEELKVITERMLVIQSDLRNGEQLSFGKRMKEVAV